MISSKFKWHQSVWFWVSNILRYRIPNFYKLLLNGSTLTLVVLFILYFLIIFPIKDNIDGLNAEITDLQSDLIEAKTLVAPKNGAAPLKYFDLPKGTALSGLLKDSLDKFELRYSVLNVKEGSEFILSVNLDNADYEVFMLWLDFVRKNYALRPVELDIKKSMVIGSELGRQADSISNSNFKISLRLRGIRL